MSAHIDGNNDPNVGDDPDQIDNGQPQNPYIPYNVPLNADVGDERSTEDESEGRDSLRRAATQQLNQNQVIGSHGQIFNRPGEIPAQDTAVEPVDDVYQELQIIDSARPANARERAPNGSESLESAPRYDCVSPIDALRMEVSALAEELEAAKAEAVKAKKAQNQQAADIARRRKYTRINAVIGGLGILGTLGATLYAIFKKPSPHGGPIAINISGGSNVDPTKTITLSVANQAKPGPSGKSIDTNSIMLVTSDLNNPKKLTIAENGIWTVQSDGTVTFTPDSKFPGGMVSVLYTIADTANERSVRAQLTIGYLEQSIPGTGGPIAQSFEQQHAISDKIVIDVAASAKPGKSGDAVKAGSVKLIGADKANPKTRFLRGQGTWTADDKGEITFEPINGFLGGEVSQSYTIDDVNGNTSDSASINLSFFERAKVFDILQQVDNFAANTAITVNVLDGTAGVPKAIAANGLTIDGSKLVIMGLVKSGAEEKGPDATLKNSGKELDVDDEGVWKVTGTKGEITFTPDAKLTGDPHPILFQVGDSKDVLSNAGTLVLSNVADKVVKALGAINSLDDTAFWTMVDTKIIKADLGTDPINKLLLMRSIISSLWMNTYNGIASTDTDSVATQRDALVRGVLGPDFTKWRAGNSTDAEPPLSPAKLFTLSKAYDDTKVGLPKIPLATRYIRLTYIHLMLGFFARYVENSMKSQAAGRQN